MSRASRYLTCVANFIFMQIFATAVLHRTLLTYCIYYVTVVHNSRSAHDRKWCLFCLL